MSQEIAQTILQQIKAGSDAHGNGGTQLLMCWGYHEPFIFPATEKEYGGLIFNVQGHHHTGKVCITLAPDDTYTIRFLDKSGKSTKHEIEGMYCDMLTEVIDSYVESNSMGHHV